MSTLGIERHGIAEQRARTGKARTPEPHRAGRAEVFRERGFDAATTREIAARAGVGNATLFLYARDKTQLLAWVFRDELAAISESTQPEATVEEPFVDRLERFFRPLYELWARDPRLSRTAVRAALTAYTERGEATDRDRIATAWPPLLEHLATIVLRNQRDGIVDPTVDPRVAARLVFDVYTTEVHDWLALPKPIVDDGLRQLRTVLTLASRSIERCRA